MILKLHDYWSARGCLILQPYDMRMGAGTFHPATTLARARPRSVERRLRPALPPPDRRPLWREPQPAPALLPISGDPEAEPARSAGALSRQPRRDRHRLHPHDIRFVEDDWESPTLGAWGLGWEVWCDGMEVTQFTYFQQMGGFDCKPVAGELTYGLERLAMYIQNKDSVYDLAFNDAGVSYGDVFLENEKQMSKWNFEIADTEPCSRVPQGGRRMRELPQGAERADRRL
jgi:glycyl-tRNA synthetase alpha chain